ncbi:TetR/AcrR family transcriptional regulator [Niallia circulans]|uniref:TetR/AcrR family transcriptional regulator n=1 Tax=Niallia circulans TaxID=1397 RepID=A0A941G865_NIACI|nr:TetR/AcrR family transcriptional regulator [Niallia circulans]MCB5235593.1 TetR/AcrR family transcriptional regulator [Niallia circulans]
MNGFEKRTEEKKKKVLEATFELMNRDSNDRNVTMEDIANHANVAKATVFKYFSNKENLIHEVFLYYLEKMIAIANDIMDQNRPFEETLIALSQNKISFLNQINQSFYLKMMEYLTEKDDDGWSMLMQKYTQDNYTVMLDLFHRGRKEGKVDLKYSDEFLLLYFQAIVEGISSPQIYEKIAPYTEEWTEMLIKGIAPRRN